MAEFLTMPIRGDLLSVNLRVRERLVDRTTAFQRIEIVDTEVLGRMLFLDGHVQLAEFDEAAYHELLVQIPALTLGDRLRRALVVGGGDGGALRELLKHPGLERVDMVEIDAGVIEASRAFLPFVSAGAFDDPRAQVHVADAFAFVRESREIYDLIVADSTDVYEGESGALSEMLFTRTFYADLRARLSPHGLVVTQADNPVFCPYSLRAVREEYAAVFDRVGDYRGLVPSFGGFSAFCWASGGTELPAEMPETSVPLRTLNPAAWRFAFANWGFPG